MKSGLSNQLRGSPSAQCMWEGRPGVTASAALWLAISIYHSQKGLLFLTHLLDLLLLVLVLHPELPLLSDGHLCHPSSTCDLVVIKLYS